MRPLTGSNGRMMLACAISLVWLTIPAGFAAAQDTNSIFIVKSTKKEPDAVVAAIRSYSDEKKWQYLGENKVKQGQITLVKLCIPEVGQVLWAAGSKLSAMLPCGNIGVYKNGSVTEISVLDPRYMHILHAVPETERASSIAQPLLRAMLEAVAD